MAQAEYEVIALPARALEASAAFYADHLGAARAAMGEDDLVILLPPAGYDHTDWRRALARDLAREYAPARVNVVGATDLGQRRTLLQFLSGAKGVSGHYLETHD